MGGHCRLRQTGVGSLAKALSARRIICSTVTPTLSSTGAATQPVVVVTPPETDEQIALVEHSDALTIAVNNSYELQHPDTVYACDYLW